MQWYNKPMATLGGEAGKHEETKDKTKKKMHVGTGG